MDDDLLHPRLPRPSQPSPHRLPWRRREGVGSEEMSRCPGVAMFFISSFKETIQSVWRDYIVPLKDLYIYIYVEREREITIIYFPHILSVGFLFLPACSTSHPSLLLLLLFHLYHHSTSSRSGHGMLSCHNIHIIHSVHSIACHIVHIIHNVP